MKINFKSLLKRKLDQYWVQKVDVKIQRERFDVFLPYVKDKKVLHVGCTDYPIFNPEENLHIKISKLTSLLDGMDVDLKGLEELKKYYNGNYYHEISQCYNTKYDTVLVPETIEHVENIGSFLKEINMLNSKNYIITAPNAFNNFIKNPYSTDVNSFTEAVHPDHNCWFSPYTLKNCIQKYTDLKVTDVYLSENNLMVICICTKTVG